MTLFCVILIVGENMKRNGFTLVELLAVIALLAILATVAVTSAINISKKLKDDMLCEKIEFLKNDAKRYGADRIDSIGTEASPTIVTVGELVQLGYTSKDQNVAGHYVINPKDDSSMDNVTINVYLKNKRAYASVNLPSSCD